MKMKECSNCGKPTGHKRVLGLVTFLIILLTGGAWLLAIPFYPSRCIICGDDSQQISGWKLILLLALGIPFFIGLLYALVGTR